MAEIAAVIIAFIVGALGGALFYRRHAVRIDDALGKIKALKSRMK